LADDTEEKRPAFNAASYSAYLRHEKRLMGVLCRSCGQLFAVPRPICTACRGKDMEWRQFSGKAKLSTFTCISIVPVAMGAKGYGRDNPYCTGIVALEEGPRISARILGVDGNNPQDIKTDMDLMLDLEDIDPEDPSPLFRPA
jgi:uncharacterized OB-fold protein